MVHSKNAGGEPADRGDIGQGEGFPLRPITRKPGDTQSRQSGNALFARQPTILDQAGNTSM